MRIERAGYLMKKRNLLLAALCAFVMGLFPACDLLETCGTCERVTVEDDGSLTYSTPTIFCGDEFTDKQDAGTVEIDGKLVYWICE